MQRKITTYSYDRNRFFYIFLLLDIVLNTPEFTNSSTSKHNNEYICEYCCEYMLS